MNWKTVLAAAAAALLAAGCSRDSATYPIDGREHSLTLMREQLYFWSSEWDLALMATRQPECMRRHPLKAAPMGADFRVELYRSLEGAYILRQGDNWYVADAQSCRLQQYATAPAETGDLLGAFEAKQDRLQFTAAARSAVPAPAGP